jgi:DNA-binding response OmpR family regulator
MSNVTVGLVEDDTDQANLYSTWITAAGFEARLFKNGNEFRRRHGAESVDLLVLDWMLPDASGIELLEFVRHGAQAQLPVVMLTARGAEADIVTGLKAGADDYVIKPPRQAEFMARVQALLRRTGVAASDPVIRDVSPYEIDTQRRRITVAAEAIKLTDREFDLAAFVFRRPGRIVSRETLLAQVWNLSSAVTTRTVDTHMSRLRKKLKLSGEHGWQLTAVYQHGYRLEQK